MKISATTAFLVALCQLCSTTVALKGPGGRRLDDAPAAVAKMKRKCKFDEELKKKGNKQEFELKCSSKTDDGVTKVKDKVTYKVKNDMDKGCVVTIKYKTETKDSRRRMQADDADDEGNQEEGSPVVVTTTVPDNEDEKVEETSEPTVEKLEVEQEFKISFGSWVEYRKAGGVAGRRRLTPEEDAFEWDKDEIVRETRLTNLVGSEVKVISPGDRRLDEDADGNTFVFNITSADGIFRLGFTIVSEDGETTENVATANKMQIDVSMDGYEWEADDTFLAVMADVEAKQKIEVDYDKRRRLNAGSLVPTEIDIPFASDVLESIGLSVKGAITWAKKAEVTVEVPKLQDESPMAEVRQASMPEEMTGNETDSTGNTTTSNTTTMTYPIQVVATTPGGGRRSLKADEKTKTKQKQQVMFSFVGTGASGAPKLMWDPETGIEYAEAGNGSAAAVAWGKGGMMLAVVSAAASTLVALAL